MAQVSKCKEKTTAATYIGEFRKLSITLPDLWEIEKSDKFVEGLGDRLRIDVFCEPSITFEEGTRLTLRMDLV